MDELEKEVWETVTTYTELILNGNVEEFLKYFHEKYSGWNNLEPAPVDKQSIIYELKNNYSKKIVVNYDIIPISINIHNDLAIVHYYLNEHTETNNCNNVKHYTDILVKSENKWLLIADHFGKQESKKLKTQNSK